MADGPVDQEKICQVIFKAIDDVKNAKAQYLDAVFLKLPIFGPLVRVLSLTAPRRRMPSEEICCLRRP